MSKESEKSDTAEEFERVSDEVHLNGSRGVTRIEQMKVSLDSSGRSTTLKIIFAVSIMVTAWAQALDSSTTMNYSPHATSSFGKHSMLSTLSIATSVISAVCKPVIAKIADLTLRPYTYILVLLLYVIGYIITASCTSISAFVVGEVFVKVGSSGLDLLNSIIVADMTPLKWRGFATSMLATPYIINTWFAGLIVDAMAPAHWRWGYGMFAIIIPVSLAPAIIVLLVFDKKAQATRPKTHKKDWKLLIKNGVIEADVLGLTLMGFGWSLLL